MNLLVALTMALLSLGPPPAGREQPVARRSGLMEQALRKYVKKAGLHLVEELLVSQVPCGDELCARFQFPGLPRDELMKKLPELMGGFGYAAEVTTLHMETSPRLFRLASLTLVTRPDRRPGQGAELGHRVERVMRYLRLLAGMSQSLQVAFNPLRVAADQPVYFIYALTVTDAACRMSAELRAPPEAAPPRHDPRLARVDESAYALTVKRLPEPVAEGPFAGWQRFRVACRWVCNDSGKPLE